MENNDLVYVSEIKVEDYSRFRENVGWDILDEEEAQAGIAHSTFVISCKDGNQTVGMARLLWDHGYIAYLADVIVDSEYRHRGIATTMIQQLLQGGRNNGKNSGN